MKRQFWAGILASCTLAALSQPSIANERDKPFFQRAAGVWTGPGEIIAGKYKGTKFVCNFDGSTPDRAAGMTLDGSCRVGVFSQKMSATVSFAGNGYRGKFLDGAEGKGLDIIAGSVQGQQAVFTVNRKQLRGAMSARMTGADTMAVTVSVKVGDQMVQVLGMGLTRIDQTAVGSIKP